MKSPPPVIPVSRRADDDVGAVRNFLRRGNRGSISQPTSRWRSGTKGASGTNDEAGPSEAALVTLQHELAHWLYGRLTRFLRTVVGSDIVLARSAKGGGTIISLLPLWLLRGHVFWPHLALPANQGVPQRQRLVG